jgi:di/tricarboxylate transporter
MKKMLLGIFLLILSVWCYLFGVVDDLVLFSFIGVFLPIAAIVVFLIGFFEKDNRS